VTNVKYPATVKAANGNGVAIMSNGEGLLWTGVMQMAKALKEEEAGSQCVA